MGILDTIQKIVNYRAPGYQQGGMGLLSALPSPYGDVAGLMSDVSGYISAPESLTPASGLLSLAGVLPGVPSKAIWVDELGKPIKNKLLRKALQYIRPSDFNRLDDQIAGLANQADTLSGYVPSKSELDDALKVLEKHKGKYFPGPTTQTGPSLWINSDYSQPLRDFGPPKPMWGGVVQPPLK